MQILIFNFEENSFNHGHVALLKFLHQELPGREGIHDHHHGFAMIADVGGRVVGGIVVT